MLIVKAYINGNQIDEVHVWNTGNCVDKDLNIWEYHIVKPTGFEEVPIFHHRDMGWRHLFSNVISVLERFPPKLNKKKKKVKKKAKKKQ